MAMADEMTRYRMERPAITQVNQEHMNQIKGITSDRHLPEFYGMVAQTLDRHGDSIKKVMDCTVAY